MSESKDLSDFIRSYLKVFVPATVVKPGEQKETIATSASPEESLFLPFLDKDFNAAVINDNLGEEREMVSAWYKKEQLQHFISKCLYALSYIRFTCELFGESPVLGRFFVENKAVGLVSSLGLFQKNDKEEYENNCWALEPEQLFTTPKRIEAYLSSRTKNFFKDLDEKQGDIFIMLRALSAMIALEPETPKAFGYTLETLMHYYFLVFVASKKPDILGEDLFKRLMALVDNIISIYEKNFAQKDDTQAYADTVKLVYKLKRFKV